MEIRNEIDAKFILKHRAVKEVDKYYSKNRTYWLLGIPMIPVLIFGIVGMAIMPNDIEDVVVYSPLSIGVALIILMMIWCATLLAVMYRREKDIEKMTKKFFGEEKAKGSID